MQTVILRCMIDNNLPFKDIKVYWPIANKAMGWGSTNNFQL